MARRIGNGADLSAGPEWERGRGRRKSRQRRASSPASSLARSPARSPSPRASHHLNMIGLIPAKTVEVQKRRLRKPRFDQAGTRSLKTELPPRPPAPPGTSGSALVILTYICVASRGALGRGGSPKNRHLARLKMLALKKKHPKKGDWIFFRAVKVNKRVKNPTF